MSSFSGAKFDADLAASEAAAAASANGSRDAALLRQAQSGDRAAYGQIVVAYRDRLYNAILRVVGDPDEAAEISQEAFTRGLMKIDSFRGEASAYTWLFRIAMNLAISQLRKVQRHRVFSLDRPSSSMSAAPGGNGRIDSEDQASGLVDRVARDGAPAPLEVVERRERDG